MENDSMSNNATGNNKVLSVVLAALVLALIVGGGYWLMQGQDVQAPQDSTAIQVMDDANDTTPSPAPAPDTDTPPSTLGTTTVVNPDGTSTEVTIQPITTPAVQTFSITGGNFAFDLKEIKVKKGDTVRITFTNNEGFHDLVIDAFNAKTSQIAAGKTETIEFVADRTGTFEYFCSVGTHRQMGMKGNLIVE